MVDIAEYPNSTGFNYIIEYKNKEKVHFNLYGSKLQFNKKININKIYIVENSIKLKFPQEYKLFICECNGVTTMICRYVFSKEYIPIFKSKYSLPDYFTVYDSNRISDPEYIIFKEVEQFIYDTTTYLYDMDGEVNYPKGYFIFARQSSTYFCFNLNEGKDYGKVYICNYQFDNLMHPIADSFNEFLFGFEYVENE